MEQKTISQNSYKSLVADTYAAIINGVLVHGIPNEPVYVTDESQLAALPHLPVGTLAIQYGFGAMWQLKPDGTWAEISTQAETPEAQQTEEEPGAGT